jgi:hypothetical protein
MRGCGQKRKRVRRNLWRELRTQANERAPKREGPRLGTQYRHARHIGNRRAQLAAIPPQNRRKPQKYVVGTIDKIGFPCHITCMSWMTGAPLAICSPGADGSIFPKWCPFFCAGPTGSVPGCGRQRRTDRHRNTPSQFVPPGHHHGVRTGEAAGGGFQWVRIVIVPPVRLLYPLLSARLDRRFHGVGGILG